MALKKYAEKLDNYFERLASGKADKIKASHVEKVVRKLKAKEQSLIEEIAATEKETKKTRLERKVMIAREHISRAEQLLAKLAERTG